MSHATLHQHLSAWAQKDATRSAVADTIVHLAKAGIEIAAIVRRGPLDGDMAGLSGGDGGGDAQKALDLVTNDIMKAALKASPVAWMGSEEDAEASELNAGAPLVVNVDPLDGSSNIDANVSIGTIFSILPSSGETPLLQAGRHQLGAGFIVYGPQTSLVLTVGQGTQMFWLDDVSGEFVLVKENVKIASTTGEYAVNSSNFRHWDDPIKAYVVDCALGTEGPRKKDFGMRWVGSLVADTFRILTRGGIYLYPGDARKGYAHGRLRLLYEANPIAMLVEQAGGAATTGVGRVLDEEATSLHQRVPLIFGSTSEVDEVHHYYRHPHSLGDRSPLFANRGLFRAVIG